MEFMGVHEVDIFYMLLSVMLDLSFLRQSMKISALWDIPPSSLVEIN
jgi:hypothetical protein